MKRAWAAGVAIVGVLALTAASVSAETVHVFAAASLTEAFRDVALAYEMAHPGDSVELNFAGSQVLRMQIEQGAPADVFASADPVHAEALRGAGLLGVGRVFAKNKLVVVVPPGEAKVRRVQDLVRPGLKIVIAGPTVPAGRYTAEVLARLDAAGLYGDDFQARVRANVVSQETNVRAVLSKVVLGEADAGFAYVTDAAGSDTVRTIEVPIRYNVVAEYPIGVVTRSKAEKRAQAFVEFVLSREGQGVLGKYGFAR
jgi:molybdate transport system substrate-binding protein